MMLPELSVSFSNRTNHCDSQVCCDCSTCSATMSGKAVLRMNCGSSEVHDWLLSGGGVPWKMELVVELSTVSSLIISSILFSF